MQPFDMASSSFSNILTTLRLDFLICDFFQPWAPPLTLSLNITTVQFVVIGNKENFVVVHAFKSSGILFKIPQKIFFLFNTEFFKHLEQSSGIMVFRSLREIEGKYLDDLSAVTMKKILLVATLVRDPIKPNMILMHLR